MRYISFDEHGDYREFKNKVGSKNSTKKYTEEELKEWEEWAKEWMEEKGNESER